jgi:hypothetical protein
MLLLSNLSERNQFNIVNAAIDFYLEIFKVVYFRTCRSNLVQILDPSISVKGIFLGSGNIPGQLQHLSPLEKKNINSEN